MVFQNDFLKTNLSFNSINEPSVNKYSCTKTKTNFKSLQSTPFLLDKWNHYFEPSLFFQYSLFIRCEFHFTVYWMFFETQGIWNVQTLDSCRLWIPCTALIQEKLKENHTYLCKSFLSGMNLLASALCSDGYLLSSASLPPFSPLCFPYFPPFFFPLFTF